MDVKALLKPKKKVILYGFLREYEITIDQDFYNVLGEGRICNLLRVYVLVSALLHAPWIPIGLKNYQYITIFIVNIYFQNNYKITILVCKAYI